MKMMKRLMVMVLMASLFVAAGCNKSSSSAETPKTFTVNGVPVAMPELQQSLMASKDAELQASAGKLAYTMRYHNYPAVQEELTKLAANPKLTDDQKKLLAQVEDQLKQAVAKQPAQ